MSIIKQLPIGMREFIERERIKPASGTRKTGSYKGTPGIRANKYDDQGNLLTSEASVNINVTALTVGTSTLMLLDQNPTRKYLLIQNTSAGSIAINFGAGASMTLGLVLTAGFAYEMLRPTLQSVYIIGNGAGLTVICLEGT